MKVFTVLLALGILAGSIWAQAQPKAIDYTEMSEDIEVMCRIIDKTMQDTFKKEYRESGFFGGRGCQGFYLNGYGVVFQLDLRFPVADRVVKVLKTEKPIDLWDRYEREIRRQPQPEDARLISEKNEAYDEDKVDKLKQQLATLAGEYGMRLGQLHSDDMISFVVSGRTGDAFTYGAPFVAPQQVKFHTGVVKPVPEPKRLEELNVKVQELQEQARENAEKASEEMDKAKRELKEAEKKLHEEIRKIEKDHKIWVNDQLEFNVEFPEIGGEMRIIGEPEVAWVGPQASPPTTLILSFNRSQLQGKKGTDWEQVLKGAQVVQY